MVAECMADTAPAEESGGAVESMDVDEADEDMALMNKYSAWQGEDMTRQFQM